jgi:hypothetical protein
MEGTEISSVSIKNETGAHLAMKHLYAGTVHAGAATLSAIRANVTVQPW